MLALRTSESDLSEPSIRAAISAAVSEASLDDKRILIIIPDRTRTAPIPMMFRLFFELLSERVKQLDYLIALGTHRLLTEESINQLIGVSEMERAGRYGRIGVFNHRWDLPDTFVSLGRIPEKEIEELTGGMLREAVDVRLNRLVLEYDYLFVCGPTFPHEVVGFSGGNKYFFPGIGGAEVINFSHWLGAVITSYSVIGTKETPVRRLIDKAASMIDRPRLCFSMVVQGERLVGLFIGTPEEAYSAAADLSAQVHIRWIDKPFKRVLSIMPPMYEDIWTAAKGMYKVEPVVDDGGEVIIYAPHITQFSYTHGPMLEKIGYHTRDFFLKQWARFKDYPGGVLAHSTHLRGLGTFDENSGIETPRIKVKLATGISEERCARVNLGYLDPQGVRLEDWMDREGEGILVVPKAGELLYRLTSTAHDRLRQAGAAPSQSI
jgi:nickel-dependent lactate racemase